jgi:hypothetical protein
MSWKSFASVVALTAIAASQAAAVPTLTFVNNADSTGTFRVTPSSTAPFTAPSVGDPDSLAFELQVNITAGGPAAATVGAGFPTANPGGAAYAGITWTGGNWNGLSGNNSNTIKASFGSNLFTSAAPVDILTIDLAAAGSLSYFGVIAQDGRNTIIGSTASPLTGSITAAPVGNTGDFSGDGRVDGADLSLLLANWGATVPPTPSGWTGAAPTASAIDSDELSRLLANWGFGTSTAIPEPSAAVLALVAGIGAFARRRNG